MRSMPSTSKVTWFRMTSATLRGILMIGSGRRRSFGITTALSGSIIEAAKADLADRPEPFLWFFRRTRVLFWLFRPNCIGVARTGGHDYGFLFAVPAGSLC